ncbi:MAG TPA: deoxyguanosinetriphosphate triphosphohydrolase family protein [Candidatus Lambdaproteobacteria bacterium]|nr:deoxyguanosinetriphosphate triphosphohydrolase family protein [Candidatus Lambdaproteobacteria bacterium]
MNTWTVRRAPSGVQRQGDQREEYERDRARIIHSSAFRRLQAKTQILGVLEGDFHRTRLTHSMEVAQIGRGLVLNLQGKYPELGDLLPRLEQIETTGLAHDLGHPPFGHGGESALNYAMANYGGFEGNGQTLRILTKLESHTPEHGLDLTRRTLLGVLKYPVPYSRLYRKTLPVADLTYEKLNFQQTWQPPKCYLDTEQDVLNWILFPLSASDKKNFCEQTSATKQIHGCSLHKALDTSLMNLADDIAYGIHDFEDGIVLRLLTQEHWQEVAQHLDHSWAGKNGLLQIETQLFKRTENSGYNRKQAVGALVHALITSAELKLNKEFEEPLLGWNALLPEEPQRFLKSLKATVSRHVIQLNTVQAATYRGRKVVLSLFEALSAEPEMLLPSSFQLLWKAAKSEHEQKRIICDFIAGMTDQYANRFYERLFLPGHGSVFDRL